MAQSDRYENPLGSRYASAEMADLWGRQNRVATWRRLWVALAEAQQELGLAVTDAQIRQMREHVDTIDFEAAAQREREVRHDVMAHVHAFGLDCPDAKPIIHWGATSCYVTDNTDLVLLRDALGLVACKLAAVIDALGRFATEHRALPTLGLTHFQPAQLTTVGKRACLWAYDLVLDLAEIERRQADLRFRGAKGTTGTQASYLALFAGDHDKVRRLDDLVAHKMGFDRTYPVTGQTYTRKVDMQVLHALAGVGTSAHKCGTDLRLLAGMKEIEEPFGAKQIGSSAMAYKRNPMRCERLCSLSRLAVSLSHTAEQTAAVQWMERTLDDSAARRVVLPEAFLAIDAVLILQLNIARGLVVYPQVIARHVADELPFMATENILMKAVQAGGDRQDLHERIRQHSQAAAARVKQEGRSNDLIERLRSDAAFASIDLDAALDPQGFVGRAPDQVDEFVSQQVEPIRQRYAETLNVDDSVRV